MSSSGRYQSRLFNLFSRQSRRLSDRLELRLRQAKVAVTWSAQILLYPIYALSQTTRLVSRQIKQTVQQVLPRLGAAEQAIEQVYKPVQPSMPLTADTPIQHTLAAVESFELPIFAQSALLAPSKNEMAIASSADLVPSTPPIEPLQATALHPVAGNPSQIQSVPIRGIASLLETQKLVLTTIQNEILDILAPEQQAQLRQRMIWELASYWRSRRQANTFNTSQSSILLPLPADQPHLLPPVRLFRRLMTWVQTSPVAIAANLFQEAALIPASALVQPFDQTAMPAIEKDFELALPTGEILPPINRQTWKQWVNRTLRSTAPIAAQSPGIQSPTTDFVLETGLVVSESASLVTQRPVAGELRHLLRPKWDKRLESQSKARQQPIPVKGYTTNALPPAPYRQDRTVGAIVSEAPTMSVVSDSPANPVPSDLAATAPNSPTASPSWIETEATLVGYVKHPLEQLLEWLDLGMLWLEKLGTRVWRWIRG